VSQGYDVQDPAWAGGADPAGTADSAGAFQAALDAVAAAGGGCLHVPAGHYKLGSALSYNSPSPLRVSGDGPQISNLHGASTAPGTYLSITGAGTVTLENPTVGAAATVGHGLTGLLAHAGRVLGGGGDAGLLLVVAVCDRFPALGHGLDAAAADRDDGDADQGGQRRVEDGVDHVRRDVQLVERGDDADSQDEPGGLARVKQLAEQGGACSVRAG
jgi:hypothetical protein